MRVLLLLSAPLRCVCVCAMCAGPVCCCCSAVVHECAGLVCANLSAIQVLQIHTSLCAVVATGLCTLCVCAQLCRVQHEHVLWQQLMCVWLFVCVVCTRRRDAFTMNMLEIPQGAGSGFLWDDKGELRLWPVGYLQGQAGCGCLCGVVAGPNEWAGRWGSLC